MGICERCGTVTAFRTTTPVVRGMVRGKTYYCPVCGMYKLLKVEAVPNTGAIENKYNELRLGVILSEREGNDDATTEELAKQAYDHTKPWYEQAGE